MVKGSETSRLMWNKLILAVIAVTLATAALMLAT